MPSRLSIDLAAVPASIPGARYAVTDLCENLGIRGDLLNRLRIAATEACTNCVLHAYPEGTAAARFTLEARVERDELVMIVRDEGVGMRSETTKSPRGHGFRLLEHVADAVYISSRQGRGTRVGMRFSLPATPVARTHLHPKA
jgi:anti-sigma regulatory factor (Ser/Thr protein kinase)